MSTTIKARTARIAHRCDNCRRKVIAAGHRYLRHTAFPGSDINTSARPYSLAECIACLSDREEAGPLLIAGACGTFCCGVTPCARPFGHDGDHSGRCCLDTVPSRPHVDEPRLDRPVTTIHAPALSA